jgi:MarR family transcriptional regulator, transcriptional regulator for hemolysin
MNPPVQPSPLLGRQVVDVSFLLAHSSHVLATRMTAAFAEIGITPREYCVLAHAMGGQHTQIELATLADLDKTTMLNTMDYLLDALPKGQRVALIEALSTLVPGLLAEPAKSDRPVRRPRATV